MHARVCTCAYTYCYQYGMKQLHSVLKVYVCVDGVLRLLLERDHDPFLKSNKVFDSNRT